MEALKKFREYKERKEYKEHKGNKKSKRFKMLNGLIQAMDQDVQLHHIMPLAKNQLWKCQNRQLRAQIMKIYNKDDKDY